jgi:inhibitor of cysteine peptidase
MVTKGWRCIFSGHAEDAMRNRNIWVKFLPALFSLPVIAATPTFDPSTGLLTLPEVAVGQLTYGNVILQFGADGRFALISATPPIQVSETASGRTLEMLNGQFLGVTLRENTTTGYQWLFDDQSINVIARQGEPMHVPDLPVIPGSGGTITYAFKAIRTGSGVLRFEYRRPWETGVQPAQVAQFQITVR